jgi:hypothetical protein
MGREQVCLTLSNHPGIGCRLSTSQSSNNWLSRLFFHSIARFSSKLVNNPHHCPSRNRNPCQVIGVDLPAFLLSKSIDPEPVRVPNIPLGFCFRVLEPCDLLRNSLAETHHSSLATNHCRKIKNPASSAGYSHPHLGGSTRCSTSFYPVLVKNLTIGSTSGLRLFLRWEDASSTRL